MRVRLEIAGFTKRIDIAPGNCGKDVVTGRDYCEPPMAINIPVIPPLGYFWAHNEDSSLLYPITITFYRTDFDPAWNEWVYAESYYEKEKTMKIKLVTEEKKKEPKKEMLHLHRFMEGTWSATTVEKCGSGCDCRNKKSGDAVSGGICVEVEITEE